MKELYGRRTGNVFSWFRRDPARSNQWCPYCGVFVGAETGEESDKEHLVGRNFVPKGLLNDGGFNFIFRSCRPCNEQKAAAERHVSSITLFNSPARNDDGNIDMLARRKGAGDFHPDKKGVLVQDSFEEIVVEHRAGPLRMTATLIGDPQLRSREVQFLALRHIQGLFSLLTTANPHLEEKNSRLSVDRFRYFRWFPAQDWGNPQLAELVRRVNDWDCLFAVYGAGGFFKAIIRGDPGGTTEWFWALEWNQYARVVGAICHPDRFPEVFADLPSAPGSRMPDGSILRKETPIDPSDDRLFDVFSDEDE